MKRILVTIGILMVFVGVTRAQEKDPMDISSEMEKIEKYGVPTIASVEKMKHFSDSLYDAKAWEAATEELEKFAKNANWLANLLSQCGEPYYSASYDDKKNMSYSTLKPFAPFETKANSLKAERNEAYVKMGICQKELGNTKKAVAYLYKGLDLLSIDQREYWLIAKDAIAEIVGFSPDK